MPEGDRLGRLHMGIARHDVAGVLSRPARSARWQSASRPCVGALARRAHPEPEIGHHLVVARARGVQPPRRRADDLGKPRFDIEMDVFEFALEDEFALGDFLLDLVQALEDRLAVRLWR